MNIEENEILIGHFSYWSLEIIRLQVDTLDMV
jgi:hypothetical protein